MRKLLLSICFIAIFLSLTISSTFGQLTVNPNQTAAVLATKLAGPGITISAPTLTCAGVANGTFVSVATPLTIDSGILLTTGKAINAAGLESFLASTNNGTAGDPALATLALTATLFDACYLEFDFVPNGDTVSFNYQFGSEEYNHSTCGPYNDAFAFFISGPGITGTQNMALVPGTTIPVTVNSINSGVPGPGYTLANCTSMGPGSPFTAYFYNNTGGTQLTYKGYTTKLAAVHDVIPCNTYHLKLSICDAGNSLYDSGVFIEAGSLKTNTYHFDRADSVGATVNGIPNTIVKGCASASVTVVSGHATAGTQTVHFTFGGTAVNGTDYATLADSAIIAAGDTTATISITGIATPVAGTKSLIIYLESPFSCGIVDSFTINIMDTPTVAILTPDTAICPGNSFTIRTAGTPGLAYSWSPATGLSSVSIPEPVASPVTPTDYVLTATLPGAGCAPLTASVMVGIGSSLVNIVTPDTSICIGTAADIITTGTPGLIYSWTPATGLSNANIPDPVATPTVTTTYSLTATTASGCPSLASVTVTVLSPNATITTQDTSICAGNPITIMVTGDPTLIYSWSPATSLDNAAAMQPVATPVVKTTYVMTATIPGSVCTIVAAVTINITTITVDAGPDQNICPYQPIKFTASPAGSNFSYTWSGPGGFTSSLGNPVISSAQSANTGLYTLTATNSDGCTGQDTTGIVVYDSVYQLTNVTASQSIPYGASIYLSADNETFYTWSPDDGSLSNPAINNPIATPLTTTTYMVQGMDFNGCIDTALVTITVNYDDPIVIPSAFTPNNDGLNDVFKPEGTKYMKLTDFRIFNRWGQEVFHSVSAEQGWDGTFNGTPAEMGVYDYMISIALPDGSQKLYKGSVTLLR